MQPWRQVVILLTIIGLIAVVWKTCRTVSSLDYPLPPDKPKPPVTVPDTATNCYREPLDVRGNICAHWYLCGGEDGKRSEVRCFHIDTTGMSDPHMTTCNWKIFEDGWMNTGGPAHWESCHYLIDSAKTIFRMFNFTVDRLHHDTLSYEILHLDNDYMILYDADTSFQARSQLYIRSR